MSIKTKDFGRKGILSFSSKILLSIFGLVSLIFVKRYMGYEVVGMLAFASSFVAVFGIVSDLGYGNAHQKRVNESNMDEGKCNGTFITIRIILSLLMLLLLLSVMIIYTNVMGNSFESKTLELIIYFTILRLFIDKLILIFRTLYSSKLQIAKLAIPRVLGRFFQLCLKVAVVLIGSFSAVYLVFAEIISGILILIILIILFRGYPLKKPDWSYFRKYTSFAFPLIFIGLIGTLVTNIDVLMIQYFFDSKEVGVFSLSQRLSNMFLLVATSLIALLAPLFSKLYSENRFDLINEYANRSTKYISMTLTPFIVFLLVFTTPILTYIFGADASDSSPVLRLLLLAIYLHSIIVPYSIQIIMAAGKLKLSGGINIFTLVLTSLTNLYLIPDEFLGIDTLGLGAIGAALGTLFVFSIRIPLYIYFANKFTKSKFYSRICLHHISGIFTLIVGFWLQSFSDVWYFLPVFFFIMILVYLGTLYLFKEFGYEEYNFYSKIINLKKMQRYVTNEVKADKN